MQEATSRMVSQIQTIAKYEVRNWATFNANIIILQGLEQVRTPCYIETMTDSLCTQEQCIIDLFAVTTVTLTGMDEDWELATFI